MRAPVLNRKLYLETPLRVADGAGGITENWVVEGQLWAEIRSGSGREVRDLAGTTAVNTVRVYVRAAADNSPARPHPSQRFRIGDRIFCIVAVSEAETRGRYLLCHAKEERLI
ncbi:MAG: phage head closure protein [Pseudoruegeria sp.]